MFDSYHVDMNMDSLVSAVRDLFGFITGVKPRYKLHGGSQAENLALQNIQVRSLSSFYLVCQPIGSTDFFPFGDRPVCGWSWHTCSPNSCLSSAAGRAASSSSAARMLTSRFAAT